MVPALVNPAGQPPDARAAALYRAGAPRMEVSFLGNGKQGLMVLEATRDGVETWRSADGATLILQRGMIRGTRGFGEGLMATDVSQSLSKVLRGGEGPANRFHSYLTGNDEIVTRSYRCTIRNRGMRSLDLGGRSVRTRLMSETCRNVDQEFENLYWVTGDGGRIVQSRQWIGDFLGSVATRFVR